MKIIFHCKKILKKIFPSKHHHKIRSFYNYISCLFYYGKQVTCVCCESTFRKFLPYDKKFAANVICPKCNSHARHRLLCLYLKNKTNFFSDSLKVLHFAPERNLQKKFSSQHKRNYISTDLNSPIAMFHFDITNIPYKDSTFDVILCLHVLEHIEDDKKAMSELFRILTPKGWAILQVPIDQSREKTFQDPSIISDQDRERFYGQADHVRYYGLDYKTQLENAGFKVTVDNYVKTLGIDLIKKYGLNPTEDVYLCKKN